MAFVTRTELNQQTARVLSRVAAGERVTVTDRGRPVADIVPHALSPWERLIADGKVTPAREHGPLDFEPVLADVSTADMIDDIRRDRL